MRGRVTVNVYRALARPGPPPVRPLTLSVSMLRGQTNQKRGQGKLCLFPPVIWKKEKGWGAKICKFLAKVVEYQKHISNTHLPASLTIKQLTV